MESCISCQLLSHCQLHYAFYFVWEQLQDIQFQPYLTLGEQGWYRGDMNSTLTRLCGRNMTILYPCQPRSQGKRRVPGNEVVMCHGHGPRSSNEPMTGGGGGGGL